MLEDLARELQAAVGQEQAVTDLQARLEVLEREIRTARDGVARREYAQVLAQLERVRAEAAALQSGTAGIEADRHLLTNADDARALAAEWNKASAHVGAAPRDAPRRPAPRPDRAGAPRERARSASGRTRRPADCARTRRPRARFHGSAPAAPGGVGAPGPLGALGRRAGLLEQTSLWRAADRLAAASDEMQRVQVSLGGLEVDEMGPPPAVIEDIEIAHSAVEDADRALEAAWMPGLAGTCIGGLATVMGVAAAPGLAVVGLGGAVVSAGAGIARPHAASSEGPSGRAGGTRASGRDQLPRVPHPARRGERRSEAPRDGREGDGRSPRCVGRLGRAGRSGRGRRRRPLARLARSPRTTTPSRTSVTRPSSSRSCACSSPSARSRRWRRPDVRSSTPVPPT